ncbi:hypothetical protein HPP92_016045 [Vanilla planifolia]|uniref:Uncharacterized protein n=1 Tax=Vanilla planifolia TaxID=51239 RepID=A0A835QFE3_VANPL|nr:hypothetical protein HPP92_016647 [Vanilla planifolia]KAG0471499.1 hypothetical protein HPP92_016045 [Vanilla planifolia]
MPRYIVPHLLFLDNYFREKAHWKWSMGDKMHVLGCLMLQNIFKISSNLIKPFVESITTMEADHIIETAKDVRGSHVLEAFLCSDVSSMQKHEVISKLLGHFGELSLQPSGSFTVEKSFTASNNDMRVTIASELVEVRTELSKIKHGPYLLRKLDIEGFARNPDQWKSRQASKAAAYRDFVKDFGSNDQPASAPDSLQKFSKKKREKQDKWVGAGDFASESSSNPASVTSGKLRFLSSSGKPSHHFQMSSNSSASKENKLSFIRNLSGNKPAVKSDKKRSPASELAELAAKSKLSQGDVRMLFDAKTLSDKKWHGTTFLKKRKR